MSFFNLFGILLGCLTPNIKCLYVTMTLKVHRSQYSAIQCDLSANVFVAVDTITVYLYIIYRISQKGIVLFTCFWRKEPRCRGGAEGQREEGEGGEKMNHRC